jgi:hypothetical protein
VWWIEDDDAEEREVLAPKFGKLINDTLAMLAAFGDDKRAERAHLGVGFFGESVEKFVEVMIEISGVMDILEIEVFFVDASVSLGSVSGGEARAGSGRASGESGNLADLIEKTAASDGGVDDLA